ncbi:MAG: hypothetical protein SFX18_09590 [Pirellulales bacterium]|nr:hypothetical protein [Pirellulales bacterium]
MPAGKLTIAFLTLVLAFPGWLYGQAGTHALYQDIYIPAGINLHVGLDLGGGFAFGSFADADNDGIISLPRVPEGTRVAIGFPDTAHEDCLIYTTVGTQVATGNTFELPLFGRVGDGPLGAELFNLSPPTATLQPGDRFTTVNGLFAGWPNVRWFDPTGVPDFATFTQRVSNLPAFNGELQITESFVRFRVIPEPGVCYTLVFASLIAGCVSWRRW